MVDINLATAYLGGLFTLLAPCSAFLLPSFFAYAFNGGRQIIVRTVMFYFGLLCALVPLGAVAGVIGGLFKVYFPTISVVISVFIILVGVVQVFNIKFSCLRLGFANRFSLVSGNVTSNVGVFLLGFSYALIGGGCSGPILGVVLGAGVVSGSVFMGVLMMVVYALGMLTPVVFLALFWEVLGLNRKLAVLQRPVLLFGRFESTVSGVVSGLVFVVLGCVFLFLPGLNFGVLDAGSFADVEMGVLDLVSGVPDWVFVLGVVVLPLLLVLLVREFFRK